MKKYIATLSRRVGTKPKTLDELKAKGLLVYRICRFDNLHGHKLIGKIIMKKYKITDKDIDNLKKIRRNRYARLRRARNKLIILEGGINKDETNNEKNNQL